MPANSGSGKIKVLIVDDSRVVRVAVSRMLGKEFEVLQAVDGADGLATIQKDPGIHVVFTDLAMPEMDGFELLQAVRGSSDESIRTIPMIIATGAGNPEAAKQKAIELGATDFVTKPFNATDVVARARSYAQFRKQNKALQLQTTLDSMTELLNPKGFELQLEKEIAFVRRHHSNITLMTIEIDQYKDLFVRIGREGAEKVIKRVSKVLREAFRKEDSIARLGLARFGISMPLSEAENAMEMANRICQTIEDLQARLDGKRIKITVSIGVSAVTPDIDIDIDTLMGLSEESLRRASALGLSQLYNLSLVDYRKQLDEEAKKSMSIDDLLEQIHSGDQLAVAGKIDLAIERLSPLMALMSNEQVQRVLTSRLKPSNNVVSFSSGRTKTSDHG